MNVEQNIPDTINMASLVKVQIIIKYGKPDISDGSLVKVLTRLRLNIYK